MKTPEATFHRLLGLDDCWEVIRLDYKEKANEFLIEVRETSQLWQKERQRLGQAVSGYDHVEPMRWRHLNVFNKECEIICALPRGKRSQDGQVYRVPPPWEGRSKHFTQEFEAFALTLMREMPVKKVGEIMGETDQRLWRMLFAHVDGAYKQLSMNGSVPAIGELSWGRGSWRAAEGVAPPFLLGTQKVVTNPITSSARFYRLRR